MKSFVEVAIRPDKMVELRGLGIKIHNPDDVVYKYLPLKFGKQLLRRRKIKFSKATDFIDNSELDIKRLKVKFSRKEMLNELLVANNQFQTKSIEDFYETLELCKSFSPQDFANILFDRYIKRVETIGIFCTTGRCNNSRLWHDFADKGKGICIGFRLPTPSKRLIAYHVNYTNELISLPITIHGKDDDVVPILNWIFTKDKDRFHHEEEVRFVDLFASGFFGFDKELLVEIYYGESVSESEILDIERIINEQSYPIEKVGKVKSGVGVLQVELLGTALNT